MADRTTYRILSFDGGGIRGLITAIWLEELEKKLKSPVRGHFDLVAGTSTGAILACGVSKGLGIQKIIDLYVKRGKEVFPSLVARGWSRLTRLRREGLSQAKYDGVGLEAALRGVFRTTLFGSLRIKPTLVTSYDTFNRKPVVFKNTKPEHEKLRVQDVCRASAAAPTYFPAHKVEVESVELPLIDGGVVANNPTACAIAEGVRVNRDREKNPNYRGKIYGLDEFLVASFGTGEVTRRITIEEAREWGAAEWALPIIDVLFDASSDAVDYVARQLLEKENYVRFQTPLNEAYEDLDNADATNLRALRSIATDYITSGEGEEKLDHLVEKLTERG